MKDRAKVEELLVTSDLQVQTSAVAWKHVEAEYIYIVEGILATLPDLRLDYEDYVVKPVRIAEVLDRAQGLPRGRGGPERHEGMPCYGDLVLDDFAFQARRGSRALCLTPAEYRLLHHLLANAERVLSKEQISRHVWGEFRAHGAIEKLVARLRRKVDHEEPALIHTRRGFGYWLGCPPR